VPSIGLGWSHKYTELYKDFGLGRLCHERPISTDELDAELAEVLNEAQAAGTRAQIDDERAQLATANDRMGQSVAAILTRKC